MLQNSGCDRYESHRNFSDFRFASHEVGGMILAAMVLRRVASVRRTLLSIVARGRDIMSSLVRSFSSAFSDLLDSDTEKGLGMPRITRCGN